MTQVVVNFLQETGSVTAPGFSTEPRVFNFEISQDAQALYNFEMWQILDGLHAKVIPSGGTLADAVPATVANMNFGTIVFDPNATYSSTDIQKVSEAINLLNNWSQMITVNSSGFQTYAYGGITADNAPVTSLLTGTTGNLLPPTMGGQLPPNQLTIPDTVPGTITPLFTLAGMSAPLLTTTMDQYMAQGLDKIVSTMRAAGWDPILNAMGTGVSATPPAAAITAIGNITGASTSSIYGFASVLSQAINAASQARIAGNAIGTQSQSIQELLMIEYVTVGNQILFNQMDQLNQAININQQALSYLNSLQSLMNQKDPQQFIMQLQELNSVNINTNNPQSQFDTFEQDTYNQALNTIAKVNADNPAALVDYLDTISATQSPFLTSVSTPQTQQILDNQLNSFFGFAGGLFNGQPVRTDYANALVDIRNVILTENSSAVSANQPSITTTGQTSLTVDQLAQINTTNPTSLQALLKDFFYAAQGGGGPAGTLDLPANIKATMITNINGILTFVGLGNLVTDTTFQGLLTKAVDSIYTTLAPHSTDPQAQGAFTDLGGAATTIGNYSLSQIQTNLKFLIQQIGANGGTAGNALVQSLNSILGDFNSLSSSPTPLTAWIQDTQSGQTGHFQQDLGNAIVSAQSFNDTQRENLREVMFVFEEFYKSADGLLSTLEQLLLKMADGIAR